MKHVNDWCFRGIYNGELWEEDFHYSALKKDLPVWSFVIDSVNETLFRSFVPSFTVH